VRVIAIANPIAGRGAAPRQAAQLSGLLQGRGHTVECWITHGPGDAGRCARHAKDQFDRIAVIGGDGTLNEVVNGLPDPTRVPIAYLACGTGNMLGHELGLPRSVEAVADLAVGESVRRIDLGRVGERRFLGNVGIGFDALVTEDLGRRRTGTLRYPGYALPILRVLARYREPRLTLCIDGGEPLNGAFAVVSNLRNYGGLFALADRACCDSGRLVVCVFERARVRDLARYAVAALRARLPGLRGVRFETGRHVRVTSPESVPVQIDGDHSGATPVEIEVEPAAVPILVP
jgi:YegS/Rv2252/BmrU family lipid kinase